MQLQIDTLNWLKEKLVNMGYFVVDENTSESHILEHERFYFEREYQDGICEVGDFLLNNTFQLFYPEDNLRIYPQRDVEEFRLLEEFIADWEEYRSKYPSTFAGSSLDAKFEEYKENTHHIAADIGKAQNSCSNLSNYSLWKLRRFLEQQGYKIQDGHSPLELFSIYKNAEENKNFIGIYGSNYEFYVLQHRLTEQEKSIFLRLEDYARIYASLEQNSTSPKLPIPFSLGFDYFISRQEQFANQEKLLLDAKESETELLENSDTIKNPEDEDDFELG